MPLVLVICLIVLVTASLSFSQPFDPIWSATYGSSKADRARSVAATPDGGAILAGETGAVEAAGLDVYLVRVDADGDTVWVRAYGGSADDWAESIVHVGGDQYLVAGTTESFGSGNGDVYVLKIDDLGDTLWTRTYGGTEGDFGYSADVNPYIGNYIVCGQTYSFGAGESDIYVMSITPSGGLIWSNALGGEGSQLGRMARAAPGGGYIVAGAGDNPNLGAILARLDGGGNVVWDSTYRGDGALDVRAFSDSGYAFIGSVSGSPFEAGAVLLGRVNAGGDSVWLRGYDGLDIDIGYELRILPGDRILGLGVTLSSGDNLGDGWLIEVDREEGDLIWDAIVGESGTDFFYSMDERADGSLFLAGDRYVGAGKGFDACLARTIGRSPILKSVADVGNDQGRQVRVSWHRSNYDDVLSPDPVTGYGIWRRIDDTALSGAVRIHEEELLRLGLPQGDWDYVYSVPARCDSIYNCVVPTLCDSTAAGICWSVFFVSAMSEAPAVYYDSRPDSGYSVDNLAPGPPEGLHMASATEIAWEEAPEEDFDYFAVYGSDDGHFGGADFIGYTIDIYMDVAGEIYGFYHVTATDFAGNEGEPATVENDFAGVPDAGVPAAFALRRNVPNPFTESTSIRFDLPERSHVVIEILDVGGRLVHKLVDETRAADRHHETWDGRDVSGAEVGPGVYFLRMKAGDFSATRKVMVLR
jgi:hypothetical protein